MKHESVDVQVDNAVELRQGVGVQLYELVRSAAPKKGAISAAVITKKGEYQAGTSEEAIRAAMISTSGDNFKVWKERCRQQKRR